MQDVKDRNIVLTKASRVESEEMAYFFTDTVRMLSAFNNTQSKFTHIMASKNSAIMAGVTDNNRVIYALPIDHLLWSKEFAELFNNRETDSRTKNEFCLRGTATPKAVEELAKIGWLVQQNVELAY